MVVKVFPHFSRDAIRSKYVSTAKRVGNTALQMDIPTSTKMTRQQSSILSKMPVSVANQLDIMNKHDHDLPQDVRFSSSASKTVLQLQTQSSSKSPAAVRRPVQPVPQVIEQSAQSSPKRGRPAKALQPRGITADSTGRLYSFVKGKKQRRNHDSNEMTLIVYRQPGKVNALVAVAWALHGNHASGEWTAVGLSHSFLSIHFQESVKPRETLAREYNDDSTAFKQPTLTIIISQKSHRTCLLNDNDDGTFSIKGQYKPKKVRSSNAIVISQDPLDPNEPPMAQIQSYRQMQLDNAAGKATRIASVGDEEDGGHQDQNDLVLQPYDNDSTAGDVTSTLTRNEDEETHALVQIPADFDLATRYRSYKDWPGK